MTTFYKRFNLKLPGQEEVRRRFVNRVKNLLAGLCFSEIPANVGRMINRELADHYGVSKEDFSTYYDYRCYHGDDFYKNLQSLEVIYDVLCVYSCDYTRDFNLHIKHILSLSETDLGVTWRDGKFYPSGAKVLDEALVSDVLDWLDEIKYTNVKAPFQKALQHYLKAGKKPELLGDVITDMYEALEAFAKVVTEKKRDLSSNRELFISKLKLSDIYKKMLRDYIEYANEYRHGADDSEPRPLPKKQEVEAFVYQTGLFIRLGVKSLG